jgi:hypothetical protein
MPLLELKPHHSVKRRDLLPFVLGLWFNRIITPMIEKQSTRREQNRKRNISKLKLTERIPQPVGTNAKMHAKRSTIEREVAATATAMAATTSKNTEALRRRSSS